MDGLPGWIPISTKQYLEILEKNRHYFEDLKRICLDIGEPVEGNLFHPHNKITTDLTVAIPKQVNVYSLARTATNIMEIGFNAGHSVLLMLIANDDSKITCFDICEHTYTEKCFEYLDSTFPNRLTLIKGDSRKTVPQYTNDTPPKFDLIHIDGGHNPDVTRQDFENSYKMCSKFIIMDDTNMSYINGIVEEALKKGNVLEMKMCPTNIYQHRILKIT